jgi:hypothetical protein
MFFRNLKTSIGTIQRFIPVDTIVTYMSVTFDGVLDTTLTQLVITLNYSAMADIHVLQITVTRTHTHTLFSSPQCLY